MQLVVARLSKRHVFALLYGYRHWAFGSAEEAECWPRERKGEPRHISCPCNAYAFLVRIPLDPYPEELHRLHQKIVLLVSSGPHPLSLRPGWCRLYILSFDAACIVHSRAQCQHFMPEAWCIRIMSPQAWLSLGIGAGILIAILAPITSERSMAHRNPSLKGLLCVIIPSDILKTAGSIGMASCRACSPESGSLLQFLCQRGGLEAWQLAWIHQELCPEPLRPLLHAACPDILSLYAPSGVQGPPFLARQM